MIAPVFDHISTRSWKTLATYGGTTVRFASPVLFLGGICAGCAPFQSLPPEDPVWHAAITDRNLFEDTRKPLVLATAGQQQATAQVRAYLMTLLPSTPDSFTERLMQQSFSCGTYDLENVRECFYTRARPPVSCATSLRVSVEVDFPNSEDSHGTIAPGDIDVAVMVTPDLEHHDDRGCL